MTVYIILPSPTGISLQPLLGLQWEELVCVQTQLYSPGICRFVWVVPSAHNKLGEGNSKVQGQRQHQCNTNGLH